MKEEEGSGKWTKQRLKAIFGCISGWIRAPPRNHWHPLLASSSITPISCGPHLSFIFFLFHNFAFILEPTNAPFFLSYPHHQLTLASETSRNNKNLPSLSLSPFLSQPLILPLPTVFLVLRWAGGRTGIQYLYQTDQGNLIHRR